jgi:hypothetical protein
METKESKKEEKIQKQLKCELCEYRCDKNPTLKKHINTKHSEQKCKICRKEFKTSMELVSHVAEEHHLEEDSFSVEFHSTPKGSEENKNSSFVFSEYMLDQFI